MGTNEINNTFEDGFLESNFEPDYNNVFLNNDPDLINGADQFDLNNQNNDLKTYEINDQNYLNYDQSLKNQHKLNSYSNDINLNVKQSWRNHKYGKYCWQSWLALVHIIITFRAIIVRIGFICFTCYLIATVVNEKRDKRFFLLVITIIPLIIDMLMAIKYSNLKNPIILALNKW